MGVAAPISIRIRGKLHLIHIALVIHIDDGRTVARDGFLFDIFGGGGCKAYIGFSGCFGFTTGNTALRLRCRKRVIIIVRVFQPVDHGVGNVATGVPLGIEGEVVAQIIVRFELVSHLFIRVPTVEAIAVLSRFRKAAELSILCHKQRCNIAAAVRVKLNPVAFFNDGIEISRAVAERNGCDGIVVFVHPTGNGFISADGESNITEIIKGVCRCYFLGSDDAGTLASAVHEVDVTHRNKLGVEVYVSATFRDSDCGSEIRELFITIVPANKFVVFLLGSGRSVERFVVLDDLRVIGCFVTFIEIEIIGDILVSIRSDDSHDCRTCRQHVERQ